MKNNISIERTKRKRKKPKEKTPKQAMKTFDSFYVSVVIPTRRSHTSSKEECKTNELK